MRTTAGLLALAFLLSLGPTGAGATHDSVGDTIELGMGSSDTCLYSPFCTLFAQNDDRCDQQTADLLNQTPFVSVKDISPYTATRTRQAKFKLVSSEAIGEEVRHFVIFVRTGNCAAPTSGHVEGRKDLSEGEEITLSLAQGTKWFIVIAANAYYPIIVHQNEQWRLTFVH